MTMTELETKCEELWLAILEKTDRTSPAEYPNMALITYEEFQGALICLLEECIAGER